MSASRIAAHRSRVVQLSNGRRLSYAEFGEAKRHPIPILYFHGYLGSRLEVGSTSRLDGHVLGLDRPGYGHSDLCARPSLQLSAEHVRLALDSLSIDRVSIIGVSAGAPYASACAAVLKERVTGCLLVAGVGGPDVVAEAGGSAIIFAHLGRLPVLAKMYAKGFLRSAHQLGIEKPFLKRALEADLENLDRTEDREHILDCMIASLRAGFSRGIDGPINDLSVLSKSWDIDLSSITAPVVIVHGTADRTVPVAHAHWYSRKLPNAELRLLPNQHHVSMVANFASVLIKDANGFSHDC